MKIISWNVNGIRANIKKGFYDFIKNVDPDILCLQETRGYPEDIDNHLPYFEKYWSHADKKGYSGTAIFVRKGIKHDNVIEGIDNKKHIGEGRVLTMEFESYFLVCVYTPNSGDKLLRLEYRQLWDKAFLNYVKLLDKRKPVIFCGDLNVAHKEIDLARPDSNHFSPGFTDEERLGFDNIVANDFIDSFRHLAPNEIKYTWWSYRSNARERNVGWRIDYFCLSKTLIPKLENAFILDEVMGSDHCPVGIILKK